VEDDISSLANARLIEKQVRGPVEMVLLHDSYHMITIDRDRHIVMAKAIEFVDRISAGAVAEIGTR
jgi:carboxylesterase